MRLSSWTSPRRDDKEQGGCCQDMGPLDLHSNETAKPNMANSQPLVCFGSGSAFNLPPGSGSVNIWLKYLQKVKNLLVLLPK